MSLLARMPITAGFLAEMGRAFGRDMVIDAVRRAADHGGQNQPWCHLAYEAEQGEDAAFVVVVGLHGDQYILDRGHERHGPDDERKRAQDHVLADGTDAAVVGDD